MHDSNHPHCSRCEVPHGRIVLLNNREPVCGACIAQCGHVLQIAECVAHDLTPPLECGLLV